MDYKGETKCFSPEEIIALILLKLKEETEEYLEKIVSKVVITVPASFNDSQRRATKDAATIAGLEVIKVLNESTAAVYAYDVTKMVINSNYNAIYCFGIAMVRLVMPIILWLNQNFLRNVLIFDLGGCNVGVSILTIKDGIFEVRSTAGETHLGGEDFVNRMVIHFVDKIKRNSGKDLSNNKQALCQLRTACERIKLELSSFTDAFLDIDFASEGIDFHSSMTRSCFEELNADLFRSAIDLVDKTIRDAKMNKSEVDDIVIIGRSSQIPEIQRMLREYFGGKELITSINPDEAVAYGATIQAAILQGEKSERLSSYMLLDVASHSIGIETADGVMCPLIKRNTTIPNRQTRTFTYTQLGCGDDHQSNMLRIRIYEGERAMAKDNYLLGVLELTGIQPAPRYGCEAPTSLFSNFFYVLKLMGIPPAPHNGSVEITFTIDAVTKFGFKKNYLWLFIFCFAIKYGACEVLATDKTTGCEKRMKITNDHGHLSKEEVERMRIEVE